MYMTSSKNARSLFLIYNFIKYELLISFILNGSIFLDNMHKNMYNVFNKNVITTFITLKGVVFY